MKPYELFSEFAWAVPKAFSVAVNECRFEQGDVLYDTSGAYDGTWKEALPQIRNSLQVDYPPRNPMQKANKDAASVFVDNWPTTVILHFTLHKEKRTTTITTTQGRLLTMLWKGDLAVLQKDSPEPNLLSKKLDISRESTEAASAISFFKDRTTTDGRGCTLFIMPCDETNELLNSKHTIIQGMLSKSLPFTFRKERPEVIHGQNGIAYAPTLYWACYRIESIDLHEVDTCFKNALYVSVPEKYKKTDRVNWHLKNHGLLVKCDG